jgi:hypothetical protein
MPAIAVIKYRSNSSSSWSTTPVPVTITPQVNALDSSKTGRNNSTGLLHRDLITTKEKWTITFPAGLTNVQVALLASIFMTKKFQVQLPSVKLGYFGTFDVYCSAFNPEIDKITSRVTSLEAGWTYKEFSVDIVQY